MKRAGQPLRRKHKARVGSRSGSLPVVDQPTLGAGLDDTTAAAAAAEAAEADAALDMEALLAFDDEMDGLAPLEGLDQALDAPMPGYPGPIYDLPSAGPLPPLPAPIPETVAPDAPMLPLPPVP
jgi:hypothetical protein